MPGREKGSSAGVGGWGPWCRFSPEHRLSPFGDHERWQVAGTIRGPSPQEMHICTHTHDLGDNFRSIPGPLESMNSLEAPG